MIDELIRQHKISISSHEVDVSNYEQVRKILHSIVRPIDVLLTAQGVMHSNEDCLKDDALTSEMIRTNYESCVLVINTVYGIMKENGGGKILGISSIAGIRGRKSNFIYGSTKAALSAYLAGLRAKAKADKISVTELKPGFVATKMTSHLELPTMLTITPDNLARKIYFAVHSERGTVYSSIFWRIFAYILWLLPRPILNLLKR